jgi:hypothetical protein
VASITKTVLSGCTAAAISCISSRLPKRWILL